MIVHDKIFLRKKRDFGDMFGTVVQLIRRNFGVLFGSIFLIAGPYILITAIASAMMQAEMFGSLKNFTSELIRGHISQTMSDMITNSAGWFVVIILSGLLTFAFLRTTMANFFVIYESKAEGDSFTINEIARKTYRDVWRVLLGTIVFSIVATIVCAVVFIPLALLISFGGAGGAILFVFLFFFAFLAFGPQLVYIYQFAPFFVMVRDNVFVFQAIGNTRRTIRGNFWWIWVLMVCMFFVVMILQFITNIPAAIFQPGSILSRGSSDLFDSPVSPIYLFLYAFGLVCTNIIHCLGDLMVGVSYYSFEEEQTGQGLNMKIDEIGKAEENPNYS